MLTLDESELAQITRKVRPKAQAKVLQEAGIPFRMVAGRPLVARAALAETLGTRQATGPKLRLA